MGLSLLGLEATGDPGELLLAARGPSGFSKSQAPAQMESLGEVDVQVSWYHQQQKSGGLRREALGHEAPWAWGPG